MARFQINDPIEFLHYNRVVRAGTVVKGPFRVEGVDHYHVKWDWSAADFKRYTEEVELICDLVSKKYMYR